MSKLYRRIIFQFRRVLHLRYKYVNQLKFYLYGIKTGKNFLVHGYIGIKLAADAKVSIGDNFYFSSGQHLNPLARNLQGCICTNEGAVITIGDNVAMSSTVLWSHQSITIGNNVQLGAQVIILDSDCHSLNYIYRRDLKTDQKNKNNAPVTIEDDVLIGSNCIVLKGVTIGARSVIGAGSVVTKTIPADSIAAGNPAKIIKSINI
jgi:acetyltransferase-like isoleucine patch superfamily enzyme